MLTMIDHRVRESIWQLNFLKWALPQNRAKWSFDRQKWMKLKNCVRIFLIAGKIARPLKCRLLFEEQKVCKTGILLMLIFHFFSHKSPHLCNCKESGFLLRNQTEVLKWCVLCLWGICKKYGSAWFCWRLNWRALAIRYQMNWSKR